MDNTRIKRIISNILLLISFLWGVFFLFITLDMHQGIGTGLFTALFGILPISLILFLKRKLDPKDKTPIYLDYKLYIVIFLVAAIIGSKPKDNINEIAESSSNDIINTTTNKDEEESITEKPEITNTFTEAYVSRVVDGDTIEVNIDEDKYKVRLIGVDTPETVHPNKPVEYFGKEASEFTKNNLDRKTVYLQKDVSETDRYGRLLRYVWLARPLTDEPTKDEITQNMFNSQLVANGYANISTYPPDVKYQNIFLELETNARNNYWGLWNEPVIEPVIEPAEEVQSLNYDSPQDNSTPSTSSYIGNANTKKFHYSYCSSVDRMNESNKVSLSNRDTAVSRGYVPCKRCNP